jgi:acetolactate synthase-1/2/3 large subunit
MKVSDYIVGLLESYKVTDVFGYPGVGCGHLMNSLKGSSIVSHLVYHEQAAAFAACSYAQASKKTGIAYTTSGPGGTNLITGIANAYCDSIPTLFIVGDKDLATQRGNSRQRQRTSQEIDVTAIAVPITKWSYQIKTPGEVKEVFEKAFYIAHEGRPGPVLIDFPSDIQRAEVNPENLNGFVVPEVKNYTEEVKQVVKKLALSKRPLLLVGNGLKQAALEDDVIGLAKRLNIPVVTTLVCFDLFVGEKNMLGYIGMDGNYTANHAINNCDLLITLGARLNFKQVCNNRQTFASKAKVIRIDVDQAELDYKLRDEDMICADVNSFVPELIRQTAVLEPFDVTWLSFLADEKKNEKKRMALNSIADAVVGKISDLVPANTPVAVDTGSHRRWVMSNFKFKEGQRLYQSSGLVSMGYSLPAAIGLYYATKKPVICFDGDGGIMMNLQELQYLTREQIPITVIIMNNRCLGDIMEFQKKIFAGNYFTTTEETGYQAADFKALSAGFHLKYTLINSSEEVDSMNLEGTEPNIIEVQVPSNIQ